ncbi:MULTISPECIES: signal peptidase I [Gordonia]|uniref:Signal peptidase I n=2 Tax=Gordonia alkanivorans TaxID=84096 RepID=F9VT19_9ACTN|nr:MULTISPECIES: signal peptidase I [Gordonia]ETA08082.1 signal peptidase [Gordonia alkanivorans CGMCC 6845]MDH3018803.1 signal peptidase I [Gordonia alkanivorans]MDH3025532.1 signal peptidase I [Gordonia alkanivorans]MDH3051154.1 signal peptidase I [Gordonia alkanivorans]MDJ0006914.1 signal peptidase I [Gordonia alkanivorans]
MADTQRPSDDRDLDTEGNDGEKRPWRLKSDPDEAEDGNRKSGSGSFLREVAIIVGCVLLLTWLLQTFIGRQYVIPSESMESTLIGCDGCTNDRIVIDKLVYRFGDPEPGDVVVFKGPSESWNGAWVSPRSTNPVMHKMQDALSWFGFAPPDENNLVKRVIATGGQTIECRNDEGVGVKVDGKPLREPYINMELQRETLAAFGPASGVSDKLPPCLGPDFGPIKVPEGNVWVMGDNRLNSQDSRYHVDDQYQGTVPVSDIRGKVRTIIYPFSRIGGVGSINPQQ